MLKRLLNTIPPLGCEAQLKEKHQFTGLGSRTYLNMAVDRCVLLKKSVLHNKGG